MSNLNDNQNGVFSGIKFNGNNYEKESTSFFEGTIANEGIQNNQNENVKKENAGVFSTFNAGSNVNENAGVNFQPIGQDKAITKQGLWSKIRSFLFQEIDLNTQIKVELTPYQQKVENEINDFLHQEISFKGISNFFKGKK